MTFGAAPAKAKVILDEEIYLKPGAIVAYYRMLPRTVSVSDAACQATCA